ncbi:sulfotransferase family protein [Novosphingobium bradum]|uniref:Sulfotransferase family protein n=1 Tax=Novosphingobium bradum TaxID=1737444 RepID=A0ABV7IPM3_9SPHN
MPEAHTTPPLERDLLVAEAQRRAGLDDLGDTWFFEPLDKLLEVEKRESQLHEAGTKAEAERIVGYLVNRLGRVDLLKKHPEILDEQVNVGCAIISLGRTGSTKTHRMLAASPNHAFLKWWEGMFPYPFPGEEIGHPVQRRALAQSIHDRIPKRPEVRVTEMDDADEEAYLIDQSFVGTMIECFLWVPGFIEWQNTYDQIKGYEELKVTLQILQWQDPSRRGKRWILKSPTHMSAPRALLQAFPDSLMVQTHRHPLRTVPSHCSMITPLIRSKTDAISVEEIGRFTSKRWADMAADLIDLRDEIGDDRFIDIPYDTTTQDPLRACRDVYDRMGARWTPEDEAAIQNWLDNNKREKWSPHIYDYEKHGLSEEIIEQDYARYIARHCS